MNEQTFERVSDLVAALRAVDDAAELTRQACAHALAVLAELKREEAR